MIHRNFGKLKADNRGSALVLTVIVMINALLIVAAIAAISVVERKASTKTKNSTPAFQAADSTMEWVLKQIKSDSVSDIGDMCDGGTVDGTSGLCVPLVSLTNELPNAEVEIYFMNDSGVLTNGADSIYEIKTIRTVGKYGAVDEERVSRALEVSVTDIGPIAWWPFQSTEAGGSNIEDITTNNNDATLNDGAWHDTSSDCYENSDTCIEFDGVPAGGAFGDATTPPGPGDDFANAPNIPEYQVKNGTVSFWFKVNDLSTPIQALWSREEVNINETGHLTFFVEDGTTYGRGAGDPAVGSFRLAARFQESTAPGPAGNSYWLYSSDEIAIDTWYFVAFTFGNGGMTLHMAEDGDVATQLNDSDAARTFGIDDNDLEVVFGAGAVVKDAADPGPYLQPFNGYMDDIRMYNRQLPDGQLDDMLNDGPY